MTMSDLSRQLLVSNGNTTTVVDRLEADGLVTRTPLADRPPHRARRAHRGRPGALRAARRRPRGARRPAVRRHHRRRPRPGRGPHAPSHPARRPAKGSTVTASSARHASMAALAPTHFLWEWDDRIATVRLDRPERKNPLTFESYAELRDTFRALAYADDVDVVVFASNGGNFCSGGDVHEIIGPLVGDGHEAAPRVHPDDRRPREGDDRLRQADHRGRRRGVRRRRGDRGDGVRPADRDARGVDGVPVHPCRAGRLRHGCVRHAAAHHRPGPGGASCSTRAAR